MAQPFISAFHAGADSPAPYITSDKLIYWYRPNLKGLNCNATDTCMVPVDTSSGNYFEGPPSGWEDVEDSIFVVALLTSPGTITVMSGGNSQQLNAPAGATAFEVGMQLGQQQFFLQRNSDLVLEAVSLKDVTDICNCGIYNFNAYVGTVPDCAVDQLQPAGLASLTVGLHVSTCSAVPSLATAPITPTITPSGGDSTIAPISTGASLPTSTITIQVSSVQTTTTSAALLSPSGVCVAGTGSDNYLGLCSFACACGYCPSGVCTCTQYAATRASCTPVTNKPGYPVAGEDDSYLGLCSFACNHGYCPSTTCAYTDPS